MFEPLQHILIHALSSAYDNIRSFTNFFIRLYAGVTFRTAMFNENLLQLGLSKKEVMLYLLLLRNGPAPVSSLAKRLELKRVSLYSILESLELKGLISIQETERGRRYLPHDPECLLEGLEKQQIELKYRFELAKECVEQLQGFSVWQQASGNSP